mgnify:CR=1 FL=1
MADDEHLLRLVNSRNSDHPRRVSHRDLRLPEVDQTDLRLGCTMTTPISTAYEIHEFDHERLAASCVRAPLDALQPHWVPTPTVAYRRSFVGRARASGMRPARSTWTGSRDSSWSRSDTGGWSSRRPPTSRRSQLGFFPLWSYAHPAAIALAERLVDYTPGRSEQGLLHDWRRRGRRDGLEASQAVLPARGQTHETQGHQPRHCVSRDPTGSARTHRHTRPPSRCSNRSRRVASGCPTPTSTALQSTADDLEAVRTMGRRSHRGSDRVRRSGHRRRRLPGAGAELGRLLPAAARLLPAGPRDL